MSESGSTAVGAFVTLRAKPGAQERLTAVLRAAGKRIRENEPGAVYYDVFRSRADPLLLHVMEKYVDKDALRMHRNSEHVHATGAELEGLLDGLPVIQLFDEV